MKVQLKIWFEVPDMNTAQKLEDVVRNYAKNDIPADVDGQPVQFLGSDVVED
jgi:hypothetical protein